MIAVVGDFHHPVSREFPLRREEPGLDIGPARVGINVIDVGDQRIETRRVVDAGGETVLGSEETRRHHAARNRLRLNAEQRLRRVDAFLRATHAVEERIADTVAGAEDRLRKRAVRQSQARSIILVVRVDQCAIEDTAAGSLHQRVGGRIEIGPVVVAVPDGRRVIPAQAEVQRQVLRHAVIVLEVQRRHVLPHVADERVAQLDRARQTKNEVGQIVAGGVAGDRATAGLP